jgi:hypothetical protein
MTNREGEEAGLIISVYRAADGFEGTNGGPSSKVDEFTLIGPTIAPIFVPDEKRPAIRIVEHCRRPGYLYLLPDSLAGRWTITGGNFAWCYDSRVREVMRYPLPIHDRVRRADDRYSLRYHPPRVYPMRNQGGEEAGLIISVHRGASGYDGTNSGPSSKVKEFTLIGPTIPQVFVPSEKRPAIRIVEHPRAPGYLYLLPDSLAGRWTMMGGNFGWSWDSRLRKVTERPLPIHDRVES